MDTHIFIISWAGQHENAVAIARQVLAVTKKVSIVYSDPDPQRVLDVDCQSIRRPDDLFWGDKFKACLDALAGDDPMLVIHADCSYPDWARLVARCHAIVAEMPAIGVWSPKIDWVPWNIGFVTISRLKPQVLAVTHTDAIVFYLARPVVKRMKLANYAENIYGRGIELLMMVAAYTRGMFAAIDTSLTVTHPKSTGYSEKKAHDQMKAFLETNLTLVERLQGSLLVGHRKHKGEDLKPPG